MDAARRQVVLINAAHSFTHYSLLILATAVLAMVQQDAGIFGADYGPILALGTTMFVIYGICALPMGWLADRFGRRFLMVAFFMGSGAFMVAAGFAVALGVFALAAWGVLKLAGRLKGQGSLRGGGWRYGIAALGRRMGSSVIQAAALGLGMTALLLLTLVLCVLLAGQWALHQRSWVAARYPALKPLLVQACDLLACTVEPLRRIDAIVIDSATLVRRLGQFHSFDIVLQNTADLPLAAPALELSLTDASDRVIARRVFLPQEWPDAVNELPPRATVPVSFRLSIASGDDLPMAGYRALVFYP